MGWCRGREKEEGQKQREEEGGEQGKLMAENTLLNSQLQTISIDALEVEGLQLNERWLRCVGAELFHTLRPLAYGWLALSTLCVADQVQAGRCRGRQAAAVKRP